MAGDFREPALLARAAFRTIPNGPFNALARYRLPSARVWIELGHVPTIAALVSRRLKFYDALPILAQNSEMVCRIAERNLAVEA